MMLEEGGGYKGYSSSFQSVLGRNDRGTGLAPALSK